MGFSNKAENKPEEAIAYSSTAKSDGSEMPKTTAKDVRLEPGHEDVCQDFEHNPFTDPPQLAQASNTKRTGPSGGLRVTENERSGKSGILKRTKQRKSQRSIDAEEDCCDSDHGLLYLPVDQEKSKKAVKSQDSAHHKSDCCDSNHGPFLLPVDLEKSKEAIKPLDSAHHKLDGPGSDHGPLPLPVDPKESKEAIKPQDSAHHKVDGPDSDHGHLLLPVDPKESKEDAKSQISSVPDKLVASSKPAKREKQHKSLKQKLKESREAKKARKESDPANKSPVMKRTSRNMLGLGSNSEVPVQTPAQAFPRGLQIMAEDTDTLSGGFSLPKEFMAFGITKDIWAEFNSKMTESLTTKRIAYAVEDILDVCATWDVRFFRPKGFIIRLDMPGEEKYGLDLLDIYHSKIGAIHTDNVTAGTPCPLPEMVLNGQLLSPVSYSMAPKKDEHVGAIKHNRHIQEKTKDKKHLETVREKAFHSTRLMIDPVVVLKDSTLADERGWTKWIQACKEARNFAEEAPPKRKDNKPWRGYYPVRMDRWPPSKHLYYDRFRGSALTGGTKKIPFTHFVPDHDSMDQRGAPLTDSVIPCDEVECYIIR
ncbi:uncharacterized protein L3040_008268 [Drepanopeziza brunnea f. sp. 'multigermtubi']|uniref:uncharacterized protein n=1 Tax=Drepanopeziza brunnea f. sp. 'multigermtubi' TaxID=698441 RepID=UPI00239B463C|nr:hypothetical protein L3040_008268 [Drepanopeziza brunnea f. sp. 'multigermtubi']